jgi:hypothetical protein
MPMLKGSRVRHATYGMGSVLDVGVIYRTLVVRFDWMTAGSGKVLRISDLKVFKRGTGNGKQTKPRGHETRKSPHQI